MSQATYGHGVASVPIVNSTASFDTDIMEGIFLDPATRNTFYTNTAGCSLQSRPVKYMTTYFCAVLIAYSPGCVDLSVPNKPLCADTCSRYVGSLTQMLRDRTICPRDDDNSQASTSSNALPTLPSSGVGDQVSTSQLCSMQFLNGSPNTTAVGCVSGDKTKYCGYPTVQDACRYGCNGIDCSNVTLPTTNATDASNASLQQSSIDGSSTTLVVGIVATLVTVGFLCGIIYLIVKRSYSVKANNNGVSRQAETHYPSALRGDAAVPLRSSTGVEHDWVPESDPVSTIVPSELSTNTHNNNFGRKRPPPIAVVPPVMYDQPPYPPAQPTTHSVDHVVMMSPTIAMAPQMYPTIAPAMPPPAHRPASFVPYVTSPVLAATAAGETYQMIYENSSRVSLIIATPAEAIAVPMQLQAPPMALASTHTLPSVPDPPLHQAHLRYVPALDDELMVSVGDEIAVTETYDDGWAYGTNWTSGMEGFFPVAVLGYIAGIDQVVATGDETEDVLNSSIRIIERRGRSLSGRTDGSTSFTSDTHP
ncbi:Rho guanine nucleotide exchange factor 35 [Sorochytrium milnesiophthora]